MRWIMIFILWRLISFLLCIAIQKTNIYAGLSCPIERYSDCHTSVLSLTPLVMVGIGFGIFIDHTCFGRYRLFRTIRNFFRSRNWLGYIDDWEYQLWFNLQLAVLETLFPCDIYWVPNMVRNANRAWILARFRTKRNTEIILTKELASIIISISITFTLHCVENLPGTFFYRKSNTCFN